MAKSESQGLQIAVIIFAFLTIALSITTFYFFNELSKVQLSERAAKESESKAQAGSRTALAEAEEVKKMIGVPGTTPLTELQQTFADDMAKYAATLAQDKKFYRDALIQQQIDIVKAQEEVKAERLALAALKKQYDELEATNQTRVATVKGEFDTKANDFSTTKQGFTETERSLVSQKDDLARQIAEKQAEVDDIKRQWADDAQAKQKEIEKLKRDIQTITKDLRERTDESPEVPDGQIRWVNQRDRTVWINLGSADYIRPLVKFSVYGSDGTSVARSGSKGKIEVTKVLGDNVAEARILEDDINNPFMPGDLIYTPLWKAGRQEHFAFAGVMDVNGDDVDDAHIIRELVRTNNAVIDAWLDAQGKMTGELTIQTRYLVVGDPPTNQADAYSKIRTDAIKLGIPILPLDKFLDYVGYSASSQFVEFGGRSSPGQFMDNERDKRFTNPVPSSSNFRPRRPPAAAGSGNGGTGRSAY